MKKILIYLTKIAVAAMVILGCYTAVQSQTLTSNLSQQSFNSSTEIIASSPKAAPKKQTQANNCANPQTQADMNTCAGIEAQAADTRLNQVYRQLRTKIKGTAREKKLIQAEQKWVQFRDADCDYAISQYEGGSIVPTIHSSCLAKLSKERTQNLLLYIESENN